MSSPSSTALHSALYQKDRAAVFKRLKTHKSEATTKDAAGQVALHLALRFSTGKGTQCTAVLEANPAACSEIDRHKDLPLHLALTHKPPPDVQLAVLIAYPLACFHANLAGDLPLNIALTGEAAQMVQLGVLAANPRACWTACKRLGNLPLHAALAHGAPSMITLAVLVANPAACAARNKAGQLPFDIGVQRRAPVDVMTALRYWADIAACISDCQPWDLPVR